MSAAVDVCLQCGESKASVKENGYYCAIVDYYGECAEDWPKHRWADWSDKTLRGLGLKQEHFHKYRRTPVHEMQSVDCAHTTREHIFNTDGDDMLPPDYICLRCWKDTRSGDNQ